jgi:hypothetical protein
MVNYQGEKYSTLAEITYHMPYAVIVDKKTKEVGEVGYSSSDSVATSRNVPFQSAEKSFNSTAPPNPPTNLA